MCIIKKTKLTKIKLNEIKVMERKKYMIIKRKKCNKK